MLGLPCLILAEVSAETKNNDDELKDVLHSIWDELHQELIVKTH